VIRGQLIRETADGIDTYRRPPEGLRALRGPG
jgi:hypothetical protein